MSKINIIEQTGSIIRQVKIGIVASRFNRFVVDRLYNSAIETLKINGVKEDNMTVVRVPGAFEIPVAVATLLDREEYAAIITLGAIIKGETPHFQYIANECARGISRLTIDFGIPIIFGVLTVDNTEQALDRSGKQESNKGAESALAALEMIEVLERIKL